MLQPPFPYAGQPIAQMSATELAEAVAFHNARYYADGAALIPDAEYDSMVEKLRDLAPNHPLLLQVGAPAQVVEAGDKVQHRVPMLSLDKCNTLEEFQAWVRGLAAAVTGKPVRSLDEAQLWADSATAQVVLTPKIDGLACTFRYRDGQLLLAATRGDGQVGEDVTHSARQVRGVPGRLADAPRGEVEVRGEIYLSLGEFAKVSAQFANPRNLAAGTLKAKDNPAIAPRTLQFFAYDVQGMDFASKRERLQWAAQQGFVPPPHQLLGLAQVPEAFAQAVEARTTWDFEADGIVVELNDVAVAQRLGTTSHHPRWAVAWKFHADSGLTRLVDVEWSVARTGTITPVALTEPVLLSGATVTRATLHNVSNLKRLALRPGDQVEVVRRGGVIPHIERVVVASEAEPIAVPTNCPSCGAPTRLLVRDERHPPVEILVCSQPDQCTTARRRSVLHYCQTLELEGFGDKVVDLVMEAGLVQDPADLYTLQAGDLQELPRMGAVMASNLVAQLDKGRRVPLQKFLCALGISSLGKQTAGLLVSRGDLAALRQLTVAEVAALHSLGDKTAEQVVGGLAERSALIDRLLQHIEVLVERPSGDSPNGPLSGQLVVFTGSLAKMGRRDAQTAVVKLGGLAGDTVTSETTVLVVGGDEFDSPTPSSKLKKARKLQSQGGTIRIVSEPEFWADLEGRA
jgi:DNA ligase (NAD+)